MILSVTRRVLPVIFAALFLFSSARAQEYRATIIGKVTDPSGSAVPNADVSVTGVGTNFVSTTKTDASGNYSVPFLSPGSYNIKISAAGFTAGVRENLEAHAGEKVQADMTLQLGEASQTVTVSAAGELLQTATASTGEVINSQETRDLPVLGRNTYMVAALTTGVQSGLYGSTNVGRESAYGRPFDGADAQMSFGGIGSRYLITLNGIPDDPVERPSQPTGVPIYNGFVPTPDSVEEVNVQTNLYDAEYGHTSGAVVNSVLRGGTNQLHGTAYEYFRNTVLDANTFDSNAAGTPVAVVHWNQPGFMLSGPVIIPKVYNGKDKTFFMVSYERVWNVNPDPLVGSVPTAAERNGDFSGLTQSNGQPITIYDPLTTNLTTGARTPFAGNIIPANRISAVGQALLNFYPLPNVPGTAGGFNNYVNTPNSQSDHYYSTDIRIDQQISSAQKLSGSWFQNVRNQIVPAAGFPLPATPSSNMGYNVYRNNYGGGLDYTDVLSATTVLDVRYGMIYHPFGLAFYGDNYNLANLGFPQSLIQQLPHETFPGVGVSNGYTSLAATAGQYSEANDQTITAVLSKTVGSHTIKTGPEFMLLRTNIATPVSNFGTFSFNSGFTQQNALVSSASSGNPFASLLLGYPASGSVSNNIASAYQQLYYGGFVQDDWRVSSRLTLNLGLRWDYESPMSERFYRQNVGFAYDTPNPLQAQVPQLGLYGGLLFTSGANKLPFRRDLNNWQPRVGAAYRLGNNTVLRSGFGIMYEPTFDTGNNNGFSTSTSFISSNNGGLTPANTLSNPYPTGIVQPTGSSLGLLTLLGQSFTYSDPGRRIPKVYQYSFGIQHQFPWQFLTDVFYGGNYAQDVEVSKGINSLPTQYFSLGSAVLNGSVRNPMAGLIPSNSALNGATIAYQNLLVPYPEFGGITDANMSLGTSAYNSLQVAAHKRLTAGFQMRASFTWDKIMARTSYLNNQDPFNALARIQTNEPDKVFVLSGSYALPFFAKSGTVTHSLLGGWNLNVIFRKSTGYLVPAPTGAFSTGIDPKLSDPTYAQWFNTCTLNASGVRTNCASASQPVAWTIQPAFTLNEYNGNSVLPGIRTIVPPDVDLSLFKSFALWESGNLEFRAEAYNLTNTPAFGFPNTSVTSSAFGRVTLTQTNDPRLLQLALRLNF